MDQLLPVSYHIVETPPEAPPTDATPSSNSPPSEAPPQELKQEAEANQLIQEVASTGAGTKSETTVSETGTNSQTGDVAGWLRDGTRTGGQTDSDVGSKKASEGGVAVGVVKSEERRKLRSSTEIQKNAVYHTPKRGKRPRHSSPAGGSSEETTPSSGATPSCGATPTASAVVGGSPAVSLKEKDASDSPTGSSLGRPPAYTPPPTTVPCPPTSCSPPHSHTTPVAAMGSSGTDATLESEQAETMEMVSICDSEFGVPEIPVYARPTGIPPHVQSMLPVPLSILTSSLQASSSSSSASSPSAAVPTPSPSFCPSPQSAFKPVTPSKSTLVRTSASSHKPAPPPPHPPPVAGVGPCSSSSLNEPARPEGVKTEAVTLGEFSEEFLQRDTSNWFRRMKLLDHIETVQDNIEAWLETVEKQLQGKWGGGGRGRGEGKGGREGRGRGGGGVGLIKVALSMYIS